MKKKDILFVIIETLLYVTFIVCDLKSVYSSCLKYAGMLLCLLYTLTERKRLGTLAMLLTCVADLFLLIIDRYYVVGVSVFFIVQIIYCICLSKENIKPYIVFRIVLPVALIAVLYNMGMLDMLNALTVSYFAQLLISCISSFNNKKLRLFSLGLSLFVCCDICVGLHNIFIHNGMIAILQWVFYLPSQVIIAYTISK